METVNVLCYQTIEFAELFKFGDSEMAALGRASFIESYISVAICQYFSRDDSLERKFWK